MSSSFPPAPSRCSSASLLLWSVCGGRGQETWAQPQKSRTSCSAAAFLLEILRTPAKNGGSRKLLRSVVDVGRRSGKKHAGSLFQGSRFLLDLIPTGSNC